MSTVAERELSERQARKLVAKINEGIVDVQSKVVELYDGRGWKVLGYETWRDCCREEFGKSASWASRQVTAAKVRAALPNGNELSEAVARELNRHPAEVRQELLDRAAESGRVTAQSVREAAETSEPDAYDIDEPVDFSKRAGSLCAECGADGECTCGQPAEPAVVLTEKFGPCEVVQDAPEPSDATAGTVGDERGLFADMLAAVGRCVSIYGRTVVEDRLAAWFGDLGEEE